jgi:hypothetical protein
MRGSTSGREEPDGTSEEDRKEEISEGLEEDQK